MHRRLIPALLLAAAALAAGAGNLTVTGSDTMVILGQKWAEVYMQQHPESRIQVSGGGSGVGVAALQNNQTDIANSSRKIRNKEIEQCIKAFGRRPREYPVAMDGLSVYVNERSPVTQLSVREIRDIYTGRITNWKEVGGPDARIILYSRENNSGTYEFFKEHVLDGRDFSPRAQTLAGTAQVLQSVAKDPHAIGYGGAAYGAGVRHLRVSAEKGGEAVEPNEETVTSMQYPIARFLYVYLNPALDQGEVKQYLDWMRSDAGQQVVKNVGYYPLPPGLRHRSP